MLGLVVKRVLWLLVAGSIAVAVFRGIPSNPDGAIEYLKEKSAEFQAFTERIVSKGSEIKVEKPSSILPKSSSAPEGGAGAEQ